MKHIVFVAANFGNKQYPMFYYEWAIQFVQSCIQHSKPCKITIVANSQNAITTALQPFTTVYITPTTIGKNNKTIWQHIQLPLALKKIKATTVVHIFNTKYNGALLQYTLHPFVQLPVKKNTAANSITIGFLQTNTMVKNYSSLQPFFPIQFTNTATENITNGNAYFVAFVNFSEEENIVQLLKAFSLFKKRLLSSMYLLLIAETNNNTQSINTLLSNYKYKNSVVLLQKNIAGTIPIIANAYASIYIQKNDAVQMPLLLSMQLQIPCIVVDAAYTKQIAQDAALYTTASIEMIAGQMIAIYKNEQQRQQIVAACSKQVAQYNGVAMQQFSSMLS